MGAEPSKHMQAEEDTTSLSIPEPVAVVAHQSSIEQAKEEEIDSDIHHKQEDSLRYSESQSLCSQKTDKRTLVLPNGIETHPPDEQHPALTATKVLSEVSTPESPASVKNEEIDKADSFNETEFIHVEKPSTTEHRVEEGKKNKEPQVLSPDHPSRLHLGPVFQVPTATSKAAMSTSSKKSNKSIKTVTDHEAASAFLLALHKSFGGHHSLPNKPDSLTNFIDSHAKTSTGNTDKFATFVRQQKAKSVKMKSIRKALLTQLKAMGAIDKNKKAKSGQVTWNREAVAKIVESLLRAGPDDGGIGMVTTEQSAAGLAATNITNSNSSPTTRAVPSICVVETLDQLHGLKRVFPFECRHSDESAIVAVDCECGVDNDLFLVQVAIRMSSSKTSIYVFDCVKLEAKVVCDFLEDLLTSSSVVKVLHDLHQDSAVLAQNGAGIAPSLLSGMLDTQLAMEFLTGDVHVRFDDLLQHFSLDQHVSKKVKKRQVKSGLLFRERPIPPDVLQHAVDEVQLRLEAYDSLFDRLGGDKGAWNAIQCASDARARMAAANGGARRICFDVANSYAISSYELLSEVRPGDMMSPTPLVVSNETDTLLSMLPDDLSETLHEYTSQLSDVVLDKGRRPLAWIGGNRLLLGSDDSRLVKQDEINDIVDELGGFGSDNRAGLERQLHRISAIRNRESDIIGLTLRFGRHVSGNTGIISDLLFGDPTKSLLFLGEPGAGKTTVVREVTRLLAERCNVCIVDTSNEIAGDGDIPHPCVGLARRMMVPSLDRQSAVMIECVQNHTPEVMVIDEIGRPMEVEAARTCKNRGVRLIASAHGDLRKLIKNPKLRGLVGGVETVTLGDMLAREEAKKNSSGGGSGGFQQTKAERAGPATFEIVVELKRGAHHEWRIVLDSGDAVDRVLRGEQYEAQKRTRDPNTGFIHLDLDMA